ncbi:MAG: DUF4332 domain-containing protein [Planctomyces sp.]
MHLQSVAIHGFRSLRDRVIGQLSAGVTILHSADSETRGDFVEFVRTVFSQRGADVHAGLWHAGHAAGSAGEIELHSGEKLSLNAPAGARLLPDWVDDGVFREICTPGTSESARFDRLVALCRASDQRLTLEAERRQAEQGLERIRAERDGNGLSGGLVHRISELRRQQGELQGRIAALRKPAETQAARIRELEQQRAETERQLQSVASEETRLQERVCQLESVQRFRAGQNSGATAAETAESLGQWKAITALMARELSVCRRQESGQLAGEALHLLQPKAEPSGERIFSQRAAAMQLCLQQAAAVAELLQAELRSLTEAATQRPADDGLRSLADTELQSALVAAQAACDSAKMEAGRLRAVATTTAESLERLRADLQPTLTLETLDQLRAAIAELEAETAQLEEQRRRLNQSEETLRDLLVAFAERPVFSLLEVAGAAVRRATGGEVRELRWGADGSLLAAIGGHAQAVPLAEVDAAVQDLIGLVLRLSLLQLRAQSGASVPLILNGVHLHAGDSWSAGTAAMLQSFAAAGQQIVVLTESCDVPEQQGRWLDVRAFPQPLAVQQQLPSATGLQAPATAAPAVPEPVVVAAELRVTAEPQTEVAESPAPQIAEPVAAVRVVESAAEPQTAAVAATVAAPLLQLHIADDAETAGENRQAGNWLFYLEADHGVDDLAGISLGELEALRTAGVQTIRELLGHTIPELEQLIRLKGFVVPVERLQALWGQAELAARVPLLRRGDAALLFAAGIHSAEELSRLRPETVYERVTGFQRSDAGARYRRAGRLIDRQQALNWARFGQFLRSLEDVYSTRSRFGAKTISKPAVRAASRRTARGGVPSSAAEVSAATVQNTPATEENPAVPVTKKRRRRVVADSTVASRRAKRTARREQLTGEHRVERAESDGGQQVAERVGGMRFFLSRTSSVATAPSIGPRTAELLQAAGLRTVEEFLSMTPERVSEKLNSRRITPTVVRQWQAQARLMCQIPELRSVDAQILVACGIVTPEALSERRPEQVLSSVQPLADSAEGQKLLKTAGQPDLATVTAWIQWAANARPFRAA